MTNKHSDAYAQLLAALDIDCLSDKSVHQSQQARYAADRRQHTRHYVGRICGYRLVGKPGAGLAALHDISQAGLGFSCHQKLKANQPLFILVKTDGSNPLPFAIRGTISQAMRMPHDGRYRYGCRINFVSNLNTSLHATRAALQSVV